MLYLDVSDKSKAKTVYIFFQVTLAKTVVQKRTRFEKKSDFVCVPSQRVVVGTNAKKFCLRQVFLGSDVF